MYGATFPHLEAEAGGLEVQGQPGLCSQTVPQKLNSMWCVCVCLDVHMHVEARHVILSCRPPCFLRQGLTGTRGTPVQLHCLVSQRHRSAHLCLLSAGITSTHHHTSFLYDCWGLTDGCLPGAVSFRYIILLNLTILTTWLLHPFYRGQWSPR